MPPPSTILKNRRNLSDSDWNERGCAGGWERIYSNAALHFHGVASHMRSDQIPDLNDGKKMVVTTTIIGKARLYGTQWHFATQGMSA